MTPTGDREPYCRWRIRQRRRSKCFPTMQLESFIGSGNRCVGTPIIDETKHFYTINSAANVPFGIGLSTYPSATTTGSTYTASACATCSTTSTAARRSPAMRTATAWSHQTRASIRRGHHERARVALDIARDRRDEPPAMALLRDRKTSPRSKPTSGSAHRSRTCTFTPNIARPMAPSPFRSSSSRSRWAELGVSEQLATDLARERSGLARNWLTPMQPFAGSSPRRCARR